MKFGEILVLLIVAAALYVGATILIDNQRQRQAEELFTELDQGASLQVMQDHIARCRAQGHRGNGC